MFYYIILVAFGVSRATTSIIMSLSERRDSQYTDPCLYLNDAKTYLKALFILQINEVYSVLFTKMSRKKFLIAILLERK